MIQQELIDEARRENQQRYYERTRERINQRRREGRSE
jgi:hypothetical protein